MRKICLLMLLFTAILTSCAPHDEVTPSPSPTHAPAPSPHKEEAIGSFESKMLDMTEERLSNIKLAVSKIHETAVQPGGELSFNETIGVRSAENGYKEAPIIVDDHKEHEFGGGICQLATAIYNAALDADLEVTERHPHTVDVPYIEEGKDATVDYGVMDLRIKNNKDRPIRYDITVVEDVIKVNIVRM